MTGHHLTIAPYDPLNRVAACSCRWHRLVGSTREAERLHAAHVLEARGGQMTLTEWREEVAS